ncbi:MAG: transcriptional regulator NrdR, partial [Clostridia bacterium]|nr:transcriptional regulator NrdR [Clostridia bacterium]
EEITTRQIGEMVMASLRQLDEVAYVRFASVYRQFTDIPTFMRELRHMLDENDKEKM